MKKITLTGLILTLYTLAFAQQKNWQHLDIQTDGVFGISTSKAYNELLKGKKPKAVIVGIVDTGVDTLQEDLKTVIWTDPKTGRHGWNYIGPETGQEDVAKLAGYNKELYDSLAYTHVPEQYRAGYKEYRKAAPALDSKLQAMKGLQAELEVIEKLTDQILAKMRKSDPTEGDFKSYKALPEADSDKVNYAYGIKSDEYQLVKNILKRLNLYPNWHTYRYHEIDHILELVKYHLAHGLNMNNHEADTAKGNFDISPDKLGPVHSINIGGAYHGTHVAGIIGAVRGNSIGMDGVADNVRILMLKENGTLREMRDDALARAIRFAVDHGAKVINLSFGKPYTWDKKAVDDAVKYAMKKDVLLVHAAGNDGANIDDQEHYPNPVFLDKTKA
ncbi:MAG TPA: S8 family serine peptidase, partial [Mucilaginibacter sp.]|nr:S8 family serine peptidase [Mucilaginibacter sp.]